MFKKKELCVKLVIYKEFSSLLISFIFMKFIRLGSQIGSFV